MLFLLGGIHGGISSRNNVNINGGESCCTLVLQYVHTLIGGKRKLQKHNGNAVVVVVFLFFCCCCCIDIIRFYSNKGDITVCDIGCVVGDAGDGSSSRNSSSCS